MSIIFFSVNQGVKYLNNSFPYHTNNLSKFHRNVQSEVIPVFEETLHPDFHITPTGFMSDPMVMNFVINGTNKEFLLLSIDYQGKVEIFINQRSPQLLGILKDNNNIVEIANKVLNVIQ